MTTSFFENILYIKSVYDIICEKGGERMSTVKKITDEIKNQINEGCLGKSGDYFYNIRDLAKEKGISYVSAQRVTAELRKCGLVTLLGNHQYITKGPVVANSELYKYLQNMHFKCRC